MRAARVSRAGRYRRVQVLLAAALLVVLAVAAIERGRRRGEARSAFPEVRGRLRVSGVLAPLEVLRDARGIPHVDAASEADAFFGLGFVHAQDRLAQMQWLMRLAEGRGSEWVGAEGLEADRWARTLDLVGLAESDLEGADTTTRALLEAYARGVNARIERIREGQVAPPLALRRGGEVLAIEDWRPVDSLAVLKAWAWAMSGSVEASLVLDDLLARLGGEAARPFFPKSSRGGGERTPEGRVTAALWRDPLRRALGLEGRSAGSSAWVLGGAHSRSGLPLLAADAHLEPTTPALLYVAHLRAPQLDVAGATLPGVPAFWTGHNRRVAWASTHARAAVVDLYAETLHPDGEPLYHDGQGWTPLEQHSEVIAVRGAADAVLEVRRTRHGPLLDGLLPQPRDPLALAWAGQRGLGAQTLAALRGMARAGDAGELLAAMAGVGEPPLAFVYADTAGAGGLQVAGWIPRRTLATDLVPVPGRARWYDWDGRIPFARLPRERLQDGRGWVVAADNSLAQGEGKDRGEWLWRSGERAGRIESRLRDAVARGPVALRDMVQIQVDVWEPRARALVDAALRLAGNEGLGAEADEVAGLLRDWNGEAGAESRGAAAYHVFVVSLTERLFGEALGDALFQRFLAVPQADPFAVVARVVREAADGEVEGAWADPARVGEAVRESLRETWFRLSYRLGGNRAKWRWGRLHQVSFRPFLPWASGETLGPFAVGGSGVTVNTEEYAVQDPFAVRLASAFRFAVDAATLDRSLGVLAPGQSEHPGHPQRADAVEAWLRGQEAVLPVARDLVEEAAVSRLVLEPAP
jgi:penicillin amidase